MKIVRARGLMLAPFYYSAILNAKRLTTLSTFMDCNLSVGHIQEDKSWAAEFDARTT